MAKRRKSHSKLRGLSGLSGLGALGRAAAGAKAAPKVSKGVALAVKAFVAGRKSVRACPIVTGEKRGAHPNNCAAYTDGTVLKIKGVEVASRETTSGKRIKVCPTRFMKSAAGHTAANSLLTALRTGMSVRELEGDDYLSGGNKATGVAIDGGCFEFHVTPAARKLAVEGAKAQDLADAQAAARAVKRASGAAAKVVALEVAAASASPAVAAAVAPVIAAAAKAVAVAPPAEAAKIVAVATTAVARVLSRDEVNAQIRADLEATRTRIRNAVREDAPIIRGDRSGNPINGMPRRRKARKSRR